MVCSKENQRPSESLIFQTALLLNEKMRVWLRHTPYARLKIYGFCSRFSLYSGMKEKLIQAHVASHMQKPFKPRAWLRHTPYT